MYPYISLYPADKHQRIKEDVYDFKRYCIHVGTLYIYSKIKIVQVYFNKLAYRRCYSMSCVT